MSCGVGTSDDSQQAGKPVKSASAGRTTLDPLPLAVSIYHEKDATFDEVDERECDEAHESDSTQHEVCRKLLSLERRRLATTRTPTIRAPDRRNTTPTMAQRVLFHAYVHSIKPRTNESWDTITKLTGIHQTDRQVLGFQTEQGSQVVALDEPGS